MTSKSPPWTIPGLLLGDTNKWDSQVALTTAKSLVTSSLSTKRLLADAKKLQSTVSTTDGVFNKAICDNNASLVQLTKLVTNRWNTGYFLHPFSTLTCLNTGSPTTSRQQRYYVPCLPVFLKGRHHTAKCYRPPLISASSNVSQYSFWRLDRGNGPTTSSMR